jgi:hypothetical protein
MRPAKLLIVGLTSVTLIALELVWTRLFSAEFFYTFAFLTLSLAVMGLGLGALALRLIPGLDQERRLGLYLTLTGVSALAGPPLVFLVGVDFTLLFSNWLVIGKFVLTIVLLGLSFFFGGMALALLFKHYSSEMPKLYMADLVGAGLGVVVAVVAMNGMGTPLAVAWIPLPVLLGALLVSRGWCKLVPVAVVVAAVLLGPRADGFLEVQREERAPVIYKHWDAMAKIKIYSYGGQFRGLNIDNVANSPVIPFDGNWDDEEEEAGAGRWDIDVGYLVDQFDSCTFLSLGAGGGADVLQALDKGATEIHAVEVIPHLNKMMLEGDPSGYIVLDSTVVDSTGRIITCAELSGHIYRDPRVTVVTEDARTYVKRHRNKFDVIYSLSSNTWAALGSGAFALAENYLFTTEAFKDYWNALTEGGFMSLEHQMYMPRLVSQALDALRQLGVESPEQHIAIYALPKLRRQLMLLSKRPLSDELRANAYGPLRPENRSVTHLLFPAPDSLEGRLINQIAVHGWRAVADTARIDISPCTDDRPYIAQLGLWRNFDCAKLEKLSPYAGFMGFPVSQMIIVIILAVVVVLLVPLVLLPYLVSREKLPAAGWLYFFLIGMAFMAVEVILIQKYTLFLGASVYSLATVLLALLIAAGIGSRFAARVPARIAFLGIVVWLLLDAFIFPAVTSGLAGLPVFARIPVAALLIAPLGFFMGMPFPRGVLRVGPLVDWGFAVNGVGSVLGATAVILCAFTFGFRVSLLLGALAYLASFGLFSAGQLWKVRVVPAPVPEEVPAVALAPTGGEA